MTAFFAMKGVLRGLHLRSILSPLNFVFLSFITVFLSGATAFAQENRLSAPVSVKDSKAYFQQLSPEDQVKYLQMSTLEIETTEVAVPMGDFDIRDYDLPSDNLNQAETFTSPLTPSANGVDPFAIIEVLFKVWDIVQNNKPVVDVEYKTLRALPKGSEGRWTELSGWQPLRVIKYNGVIKNMLGNKVIDFEYTIRMLAGGRYQGIGQYINQVSISPQADVLWGYKLNASVKLDSVSNAGTTEDPIAAIDFDIGMQFGSMLKSTTRTESYRVKGNGRMENTRTGQVFHREFGEE